MPTRAKRTPVVRDQRTPLSAQGHDPQKEDAISDTSPKQGGRFGGLWHKLTATFVPQHTQSQQQPPSKPASSAKKNIDGASLFRRGKRKATKGNFVQAVALFNFALAWQREELGENHLQCGTTLNEIGLCWMILGERYSALTALEEALYIRQLCLGVGAMEVAETTHNIWMILHEERLELEDLTKEGNKDEEEEE